MNRRSVILQLISFLIPASFEKRFHRLHCERAVAMVEMAIILPLQISIIIGAFETGALLREYMRAKSITDAMALKGSETPQAESGCWEDFENYQHSPSPTVSTQTAHWLVIDQAQEVVNDFYPDDLSKFHHYDANGNAVAGPHFTTMRIRDEAALRAECGDATNEEETFGVQFDGWPRLTFLPLYFPMKVRSKVGVAVTRNLPTPVKWIPGVDQDSKIDGSEDEEDMVF